MNISHFFTSLGTALVPLHKDGFKFVLIFAIIAILLAMMNSTLGMIGLILTIWCAFFFRDPERFTPVGENLVISPADGIVSDVEMSATPPSELNLSKTEIWTKVSVFLNVFNVHVNRVPISGKITQLHYNSGKFLSANLKESSFENERQSAIVKTKNGDDVVFVQVAGFIARRIVCDLKEGQEVTAGERYGIIRFGSRADVYLPSKAKIKVLKGQTMVGGETIIAEF